MAETNAQVRLCGFGGQGVILAGTILGYAGIDDGKWVAGSNSYGAAARGGSCHSDVVISDKPISFPHVIMADVLVAMSQKAYDTYVKNVNSEGGIVIYDEHLVSAREIGNLKQIGISATGGAIKELKSKQVANIVILGAAVEVSGVVNKNALTAAMEKNIPEKFKALNLKAVELGFKLGRDAMAKERNTGAS